MQEINIYHIKIQGQVDENTFNAASPQQATVVCVDPTTTLFAIDSDQSGLIGLLRYLHQQGFVLLAFYRKNIKRPDLQEKKCP